VLRKRNWILSIWDLYICKIPHTPPSPLYNAFRFFLALDECTVIFVLYIIGTIAEGAPIIPISAQLKYNIDVICEYIVKKIPVPIRDFQSEPRLIGKYQIWVKCKFQNGIHIVYIITILWCSMNRNENICIWSEK